MALGEPLSREIVSRLMVGPASPGELLRHAQAQFNTSGSAVSDRITQLETLHAVTRQRDGTVCITDDVEPECIVQGAHRWMKRGLAAAARAAEDEEHRLSEALASRDASREVDDLSADGSRRTVVEVSEYLDDAAARTEWERAAAQAPSEPPDVTLQRLRARERPSGWPGISWISEFDHSRAPGDLVKSPARYVPAPARHLTISSDWRQFSVLVNRWTRRYHSHADPDFLRWAIHAELRVLVEAVLAAAIVEREQSPKYRGAVTEPTLRKLVTQAMPAIDADVEQALQKAWGPPQC